MYKNTHIHFVGIGGIGMSGIAAILKKQGYIISGCDTDLDQASIKNLKQLGCIIFKGNNGPECINTSIDILVYSSAIKSDNPEIIRAQERGIPTIPRALMLAELMRTKYSVAIAGSHGKTTTTSLIAHILLEAQLDPTVIIGGHLKALSSNAHFGNGDFLVAEADESDRSLLYLNATLAIVTNIDLEHLETYTDLDDIKKTFMHFLHNLPFYGKAILCIDDPNIQSLLPIRHVKTLLYGLTPRADWYATNITLLPNSSTFWICHKDVDKPLIKAKLSMPGKHNILNALAAIALARELDIPLTSICSSLENFKGVDRRFSYKGTYKGAELFDDYGHHPQEIKHTLEVARRRAKQKVTVLFQPHRFTRTHKLWDAFLDVFLNSSIDELIVTDIYPASELPIPGVTAKQFTKALQERKPSFTVSYVPFESDFASIKSSLDSRIKQDDLVLLLGAGKINKLIPFLSN